MNSKVLVRMDVPTIYKSFEVLIPRHLSVKEILPLIIKAVSELSEGIYVTSNHEFLCCIDQNTLLDEDARLEDYGIQNGDHLLLL